MNVALRTPMTTEQFLAWEERQDLRYEFDGIRPIARTGDTVAHAAIQRNVVVSLMGRLRGRACHPYGSILKIRVADGRIRYPDAFVACTKASPRDTVVDDPAIVFEVLGEGSTNTDLVLKNAEYRLTTSIRRYVVLQQTHAGATVFSRKGEDWVADILCGDGAILQMPEIGIEIPLAEIYADIELEAAPVAYVSDS